jgi:hypothetical protein
MSAYWQDGRDRAARRGAGIVMFRPPQDQVHLLNWHQILTHDGEKTLQWRPGIEIWKDAEGLRWTAESAGSKNWRYLRIADRGNFQ